MEETGKSIFVKPLSKSNKFWLAAVIFAVTGIVLLWAAKLVQVNTPFNPVWIASTLMVGSVGLWIIGLTYYFEEKKKDKIKAEGDKN